MSGMCVCPECDREFTAIEQFGRFQQRHRGRQRRGRRAGGEGGSISGRSVRAHHLLPSRRLVNRPSCSPRGRMDNKLKAIAHTRPEICGRILTSGMLPAEDPLEAPLTVSLEPLSRADQTEHTYVPSLVIGFIRLRVEGDIFTHVVRKAL